MFARHNMGLPVERGTHISFPLYHMKKLLASATILASAGLALPALAQVSSDSYTSSTASAGSSESVGFFESPSSVAAATSSDDGLNDPDLLGDPEDDGLDTAASSVSSTNVMDFDDSETVDATNGAATDTDAAGSAGTTKVPSELPNTGEGGLAR
jgi:hypothetical protein